MCFPFSHIKYFVPLVINIALMLFVTCYLDLIWGLSLIVPVTLDLNIAVTEILGILMVVYIH